MRALSEDVPHRATSQRIKLLHVLVLSDHAEIQIKHISGYPPLPSLEIHYITAGAFCEFLLGNERVPLKRQ